MKKLLYSMAVIGAMFCTACDHYDHAIADQGDRLDILEQSTIKNIDDQVDAITTSLGELENVHSELSTLVETLKNSDTDKTNLITALQAKDEDILKAIADLRKYVDDEIKTTEDWATATFATLEQYTALQKELSDLSSLVKQYGTELTSVKTAVESLTASVSTLEKSMKEWVNKTLADGYYDIATIDTKLDALKKEISDADEALAKKIDDQKAALEQAQKDLTEAYEKAITDAIETNNGVISKQIADAVEDVMDKVDLKLAVIDNTIAAIQKDIEALNGEIATIKEQIEAINESLKSLEEVDDELETLIEALKATDEENAKLIEALQAKDEDLDNAIADLKKYVDDKISETEDWVEATFATLEQYTELQKVVSGIETTIEQQGTDLASVKTSVETLTASISTLETSMKEWVNQTLAEGYYDIAAIDAMLAALEKEISDADKDLAKQLAEQQAALEQAKKDLTEAYQKAITEAIIENNGKTIQKVNDLIADAKKEISDELQGIRDVITTLKENIDLLEGDIKVIEKKLAELEAADTELNELLAELDNKFTDADKAIAEELAKMIEKQKAALKELNLSLTKAYKDAINENNGKITKEIAAAVKVAIDQISAINDEIESIKSAIADIENSLSNLINRIQSIRFLPEYSDGKVLLNNETTLTFIVSPKEAAEAIAAAAQDNENVVAAYVSRTKVRTKSVDMPTPLTMTSVNGNAEGVLEVGVSDANLPDDFWKDMNEGNIYISISDGNNDVLSELIPILPMSYIATPTDFLQALEAAKANGDVVRLSSDIVLETPVSLSTGDDLTIDLNGHSISTESAQTGKNFDFFDVRNGATLTVKNGTITTEHTVNMGWNQSTNVFNVTAGGVLNIENATIKNLGGSDMAFCIHLNNWGEVTLNVNNSTLESTYMAVRVFNSGPDMNNVTIKNSNLKGAKYCFWVHNYTDVDFGSQEKADAQKALLNLDIYNNNNNFDCSVSPARYGFTNSILLDENGNQSIVTATDLKNAVEKGGQYKLQNDIVLEGVNTLPSGKELVLDLNGFTISNQAILTRAMNAAMFNIVGGTLTVQNGNVISNDGSSNVFNLSSGATLNIAGANIKLENSDAASCICIDNSAGDVTLSASESNFNSSNVGIHVLNNGTGKNNVKLSGCQVVSDGYCVLVSKFDKSVGRLNFDFSDNTTMSATNASSSFSLGDVEYSSLDDINFIVNLANGKDAKLNKSYTDFPVQNIAPYGNRYGIAHNGGVFDGQNNTLNFDSPSGDNYGIMISAGTIKNLKLSGVFRSIVIMYPTDDITIDNVIFDPADEWGTCYPINTAEGDGKHSLYVKNSTIAGWNSYGTAIKDLYVSNCKFVQGSYYTNVYGRLSKPYVTTVYENCDFCSKYYIDLSAFAGTSVLFKNCTVNGVKLTAENWTSLVAPEETCGEGQISIELRNGTYLTADNLADYVVIE